MKNDKKNTDGPWTNLLLLLLVFLAGFRFSHTEVERVRVGGGGCHHDDVFLYVVLPLDFRGVHEIPSTDRAWRERKGCVVRGWKG